MSHPIRVAVHDRRRLVREGLCLLLNDEPGIDAFELTGAETQDADVILVGQDVDELDEHHRARLVEFDDASTVADILRQIGVDVRRSPEHASALSPPGADTAVPLLTTREKQILKCIAVGLSAAETSQRLGISRKTVENHKRRIFVKLDVQNQAHAVAIATRVGLLDGGG